MDEENKEFEFNQPDQQTVMLFCFTCQKKIEITTRSPARGSKISCPSCRKKEAVII